VASVSSGRQSTFSVIAHGGINPDAERAKTLAVALNCHPAVLVFPGWPMAVESAA
jgi:hypothetical protein